MIPKLPDFPGDDIFEGRETQMARLAGIAARSTYTPAKHQSYYAYAAKPKRGPRPFVGGGTYGFSRIEDDPCFQLAKKIAPTLERERGACSAVRTLRDMSEAEIRTLELLYGCPVQRPLV